jgi:hypothetical protein
LPTSFGCPRRAGMPGFQRHPLPSARPGVTETPPLMSLGRDTRLTPQTPDPKTCTRMEKVNDLVKSAHRETGQRRTDRPPPAHYLMVTFSRRSGLTTRATQQKTNGRKCA